MFILVHDFVQVHNSESDIDALCVVPWFATMAVSFLSILIFELMRILSFCRCILSWFDIAGGFLYCIIQYA